MMMRGKDLDKTKDLACSLHVNNVVILLYCYRIILFAERYPNACEGKTCDRSFALTSSDVRSVEQYDNIAI